MKLDRKIEFQRKTVTDDGFSKVYNYSNHGKITHAGKRDISHSEQMQMGDETNSLKTIFEVRSNVFTQDLNTSDRILYKKNVFDIIGFKEIGRNKRIQITCIARVD